MSPLLEHWRYELLVDSSLKGAPHCLHSEADSPILGQHKRFQDATWATGSLLSDWFLSAQILPLKPELVAN